jgi:hypothetical protein
MAAQWGGDGGGYCRHCFGVMSAILGGTAEGALLLSIT